MKKILFGTLALVMACFLFATPKTTVSAAQLEYNVKVVSCDQSDSGILNEPTVVTELKKKEDVNAILQARKKPSNVIVNFDENANIVDDNGSVISDFYSLHKSELGQKVIFVVRLESDGATNAFLKMLTETYRPLDIAVLSTNPEFVKRIKSSTAGSHVRGAIEFAEGTSVAQIVRTTQESQSIMAIIPQSMASTQNVRYIQARFKTVWVRVSSDKGVDLYDCINSGTYGIITQDYQKAYDTLATYTKGLTRTPFNVAHRGIPTAYNENSISGTVAAIENGATHVELDAYLTTDKQIVMMHDNTLDRTSNGTGTIESKTLAEIKKYKLDIYGEEDIPTFDDIAKVIKDTGVVWVFEIKSGNTEIVSVLKEKIYEFELQDQLVVISFNLNILATMKSVLPEIPTANLNTANQATFQNVLASMGTYNAVIDTAYGNADATFNEVLR
ncbi:MAG: hypothetical protein IKT32_01545, partial [Clostridia bacterium]|nr:hypothetical protein [Clostridia bacterium]